MPEDEKWSAVLTPRLYEELKVLARSHLRRERDGHTLVTTALVHEAWLRFSSSESLSPEDSTQFFAVASNTMRRVLVDHARRLRAARRGGGSPTLSLDGSEPLLSVRESEELLSLDDALERLSKANARAAQVVVARYFGGLSENETAAALGISPKTVQRDWIAARAWLRKEVARDLGMPDNGDQ